MTLTLRSVKGSALTHVEMDGNFTHFRDRAGREYFPTIANNASDAEHDLDIGASRIWVSNGSDELLVDFEARTKRIDAAWAAGTNQGGLSTGTVANNTWYYLYAIYNPTTGVADYIIDPSATSPTLPSGYTYWRDLNDQIAAAVRTDGSANILGMRYDRKIARFDSSQTFLNTGSPATTVTAIDAIAPSFNCFVLVVANVSAETVSSDVSVFLRHFDTEANVGSYRAQVANKVTPSFESRVRAVGGQIKYVASSGTTWGVTLVSVGYEVF